MMTRDTFALLFFPCLNKQVMLLIFLAESERDGDIVDFDRTCSWPIFG